jgi:hypothetical protein
MFELCAELVHTEEFVLWVQAGMRGVYNVSFSV